MQAAGFTPLSRASPAHLDEALEAAEMDPLSDRALAKLETVYGANFGPQRAETGMSVLVEASPTAL